MKNWCAPASPAIAALSILSSTRHQRQVYRLCYRFVGNHEDASELAQDAFVRAYRALPDSSGRRSSRTWLHRISVNVCLNRLALKTPDAPAAARTPTARPGSAKAADAAVLREERAATVRAAIARLPDKQRATLILRGVSRDAARRRSRRCSAARSAR